jgi:hypothetical protein
MQILKYRTFHQWAKSEKLADSTLKSIIDEIENGLFEADLEYYLELTNSKLNILIKNGELFEVTYETKKESEKTEYARGRS